MIRYVVAETDEDLRQILSLQQANLTRNLNTEEIQSQGFVTVEHSFDLLKTMNTPHPHIVAKFREEVIGYVLVMTQEFGDQIEVLKPMFGKLNSIYYKSVLLKDSNYLVMGQVCIAKDYRGRGVFKGLYQEIQRQLNSKFNYLITEIAFNNKRSLRAHAKVGFKTILKYPDHEGVEWVIVLWEW